MNYVITAWYNRINAMLRKDQLNVETGFTVTGTAWGEDDDNESFSLFDNMASPDATPEQIVECQQVTDRILDKLSAPARTLVQALLDPPDAVLQEFHRQRRAAENRREVGKRAFTRLELPFLFSLFQIPKSWCNSLQKEIREVTLSVTNGK